MNCYRPPKKLREGNVFIGVTVVIPERGGCTWGGGYVYPPPTTHTVRKRAVRIVLECFLVNIVFELKCVLSCNLENFLWLIVEKVRRSMTS